jgi:hypothetical protein
MAPENVDKLLAASTILAVLPFDGPTTMAREANMLASCAGGPHDTESPRLVSCDAQAVFGRKSRPDQI